VFDNKHGFLEIAMKKPKAPRTVTVAIFTTITVIFWVFFSLYNVLTSKPAVDVDPKLLEPINPNLNNEILDSLDGRVFIEQGEALPTLPSPTSVPSVTPTKVPTISP
jgi:hypothetical protein